MGEMSPRRRPPEPEPVRPRAPSRGERLEAVLERDGGTCTWCGRGFGDLVTPTTDHVVPRVKGGPSWLENEVAACRRCNAERGHRGPAEWLAECERRGWQPDVEAVTRVLRSLDRAITERGGQRRARPYLAAQLRRLRDQAA
jgi:5-methylcytosine-specific restriction endonuclease McrA